MKLTPDDAYKTYQFSSSFLKLEHNAQLLDGVPMITYHQDITFTQDIYKF